MVLSSLTDAIVSLARISKILLAEELVYTPTIDSSHDKAVSVDGDYEWEVLRGMDSVQATEQKVDDKANEFKLLMEERKKNKGETKRRKNEKETGSKDARWKIRKAGKDQGNALPVTMEDTSKEIQCEDGPPSAVEERPFDLKDLRLEIKKGAFVAIVGRVGSGKVYIAFCVGRCSGS
jgi:ABC-type multidrug transport system fused ATPase/permease subunit